MFLFNLVDKNTALKGRRHEPTRTATTINNFSGGGFVSSWQQPTRTVANSPDCSPDCRKSRSFKHTCAHQCHKNIEIACFQFDQIVDFIAKSFGCLQKLDILLYSFTHNIVQYLCSCSLGSLLCTYDVVRTPSYNPNSIWMSSNLTKTSLNKATLIGPTTFRVTWQQCISPALGLVG